MMHIKVSDQSVKARWLTLIFLAFFITPGLQGQILRPFPEKTWLDQRNMPLKVSNVDGHLANYSILDNKSDDLERSLEALADERAGTIFLVVRSKVKELSDNRLLKIGGISLFRDHFKVDGLTVDIDSIKGQASIVKIQFQRRPRAIWPSRKYDIRNSELDLVELIHYDKILDPHQSRIVESFLALKYSINITPNSNPDLRDYWSLFDEKVWNSTTDHRFNEEVLGLGRFDQVGFYQTQSFTTDSKSVLVSLQNQVNNGVMPNVPIKDSSLLVFSKGDSPDKIPCGGADANNIWKLKLFNWHSSAQFVHVEIDTQLTFKDVLLTDGLVRYPIKSRTQGGKTIMAIPIKGLKNERDYFVRARLDSNHCKPFVNLKVEACDSVSSAGRIDFALTDQSHLPLQLEVYNLTSGSVMKKTMTAAYAQVAGLDTGQYHLLMLNGNGVFLDTLVWVESCSFQDSRALNANSLLARSSSGLLTEEGVIASHWSYSESEYDLNDPNHSSNDKLIGSTKKSSIIVSQDDLGLGQGIQVYPNPAIRFGEVNFEFFKLANIDFKIQIFDNKGALIHEEAFKPASNQALFNYKFSKAGSYLVRAYSPNYISVQPIVIKPDYSY